MGNTNASATITFSAATTGTDNPGYTISADTSR